MFGLSTTTLIPTLASITLGDVVFVLFVLQSTPWEILSSGPIHSRVIIKEEWHVSRLPVLTCSCWISMVTSVAVPELLTSACFTCHKLMCNLCPPAEM